MNYKVARFFATLTLSAIRATESFTQAPPEFWDQQADLNSRQANTENPRTRKSEDGYTLHFGAPEGRPFRTGFQADTDPETIAKGFMLEHGPSFHSNSDRVTFKTQRVNPQGNHTFVRMNQIFDQLPVFAGEVILQINGSAIESISSDIAKNLQTLESGQLPSTPTLSSDEAETLALRWGVAENDNLSLFATTPDLILYDPEVVGNTGPLSLTWHLQLISASGALYDEEIFIDAHKGKILFHYSNIHEAKNRLIYNANNTGTFPGSPSRTECAPATGDVQVDEAYDYLGDTYDFYMSEHGRDSIDGNGMIMNAIVRWCEPGFGCPMGNAFWWNNIMWFGQGFQVDDIAAHELTHGVTEKESNLVYANQSGAINESFSDMWGEWVDQTNGAGQDNPADKWYMGEELLAIRYMKDPTV